MIDVIRRAPALLAEALNAEINIQRSRSLLLCGMGGSGISADIIRDAFSAEMAVPLVQIKSGTLPGFVDSGTLQICISYSGNTWETLEALEQGLARGAQVVGITSGGRMAALAQERRFPVLTVPGGMQPRVALPGLLGSVLVVLEAAGLVKNNWARLPDFLEKQLAVAEAEGKELAEKMFGKTIIAYSALESVARRFKTQVNENAKYPCRFDVLPELNHNETVSWEGAGTGNVAVFFRDGGEEEKTKKAINFLQDLIRDKATVVDIHAKGKTPLEQILSSIVVGDFASYYLGLRRGVDIENVAVIQKLKATIGEKKV